jgi:hypothetical protein
MKSALVKTSNRVIKPDGVLSPLELQPQPLPSIVVTIGSSPTMLDPELDAMPLELVLEIAPPEEEVTALPLVP